MTEADLPPPLISSPRLPPAVQDEIDSLALLVNETQEGLIAFALYRGAANRLLTATALGEKISIPVVEIPLLPQDPNPLPPVQALPAGMRYCAFITRLEEALPAVAGILNLQRETFAESPHAVIFWVTAFGLRELARLAPDFWAWRSGVFDLRQETATIAAAEFQPLLDSVPDFRSRSDLEKRILLYQDLLQDYEQQSPPDNRFLGDLHHKMAAALNQVGEYRQAVDHAHQALQLREKVHGPDHQEVAAALNNLGTILRNLGDINAAKAAFERSLEIWEKQLGPDHPYVAYVVNNLGTVLHDLGNLTAAKAAFKRALTIDEKVFGPDNPNVARIVNNLGGVLQDLGDLTAAQTAFERALAIDEKIFGPDHPNVATIVNNLGGVLQELGDLTAAQIAFKRALATDEKVFGPEHPNVARDFYNLGRVFQELGDLTAARAAYERALAIDEKISGPDHPKTQLVLRNLASLNR